MMLGVLGVHDFFVGVQIT